MIVWDDRWGGVCRKNKMYRCGPFIRPYQGVPLIRAPGIYEGGLSASTNLVQYFAHYDDFVEPRTKKQYSKSKQVTEFIAINVQENRDPAIGW